jgi:hypothetical protein
MSNNTLNLKGKCPYGAKNSLGLGMLANQMFPSLRYFYGCIGSKLGLSVDVGYFVFLPRVFDASRSNYGFYFRQHLIHGRRRHVFIGV